MTMIAMMVIMMIGEEGGGKDHDNENERKRGRERERSIDRSND